MAIDLKNLPGFWEPIWKKDRHPVEIDLYNELEHIFKVIRMANVSHHDADLLLDHEGNKLLRIRVCRPSVGPSKEYDYLVYGPLIFRHKTLYFHRTIVHFRSICEGKLLPVPRKETSLMKIDDFIRKIKGDIAELEDGHESVIKLFDKQEKKKIKDKINAEGRAARAIDKAAARAARRAEKPWLRGAECESTDTQAASPVIIAEEKT